MDIETLRQRAHRLGLSLRKERGSWASYGADYYLSSLQCVAEGKAWKASSYSKAVLEGNIGASDPIMDRLVKAPSYGQGLTIAAVERCLDEFEGAAA